MSWFTKYIAPFAKAHIAGLTSAAVLLGADMQAGPVSATQWEAVVLTLLGVAGAVALVPNKSAGAVAIATAVAQDVAPYVPKAVAQDMTQIIPVVQDVAAAVAPVLPAAVSADIQAAVSVAQAVAPVAAPAA